VNVRESFSITKQTDGKRGSPVTWRVERAPGEQPNGTFVVPSDGERVTPKPPASAASASGAERPLVVEAKQLVDDYAAVLDYALHKHEGRVKPDEIQRLFTTAYIQRRQLSSVA
jgi:hypothetical protein